MPENSKKIAALIFSLVLGGLGFSANRALAQDFPDFPMAFWGNVSIDDAPAPVGTITRAYYGNVLAGEVTVRETGVYGYTEPTKQKLVLANGNGQITFKIKLSASGIETGGLIPPTYSEFLSGSTINKNLVFYISQASNNSSNPITGGGGGGGGGGTTTTVTSTIGTNQQISPGGDANNDGKIDLFDFNLLMINWGETMVNNPVDFNSDGKVDILDFNILMTTWTK
jgi:hypothetical protein